MSNNLTLKDIAKKSGVSIATVSRILNDLGGYSDETRKNVLTIIKESGYHRNAVARNLKLKKSNAIAVLIPQVQTTYYITIMNGIEDAALKNGYSVIICHVGASGGRTKEYMKILEERQVDGIIGCSLPPKEEIDTLMANSKIPSILVSTLSYNYTIPYVKVDDFRAEYAATEYLIKKGHRKIALLSGPLTDVVAGVPRYNGYKQALKDNNIPYNEDLVTYTSFGYESGLEAAERFFMKKPKFTAIVSCCDEVAVAALSVAYKHGLTAPHDFSVVGFDNTHTAAMAIPPLTTIAQPFYEMGTTAFEMLLEEMKTGKKPESCIVPFKIVERQSVGEI